MRTTRPLALRTGVLTLLLGLVFALTAPFAQAADGKITFDNGHMDIFNVMPQGDRVVLNLKEDVTGSGVLHAPEDVILQVKDSAYQTATAGLPQVGTAGYMLPMTQNYDLLWPGWDSMATSAIGAKTIDINILEVSGPGHVYLFSQGNFGGLKTLLQGDKYQLDSGSVLHQDFPAHVHAYWVFQHAGTYTMRVKAMVNTGDKTLETNQATYTWQVLPSQNDPAAKQPEPSTAAPTTESSSEPSTTAGEQTEAAGTDQTEATGADQTEATETQAGQPTTAGQKATDQNAGAQNTAGQNPTAGAQTALKPGTATNSGTAQKPATAQTAGTAQKPAKASKQAPAPAKPLNAGANNVAVGAPQADCFPKQVGGNGQETLIPRIKDDRTSPATWREPSEITFALGDTARAKTPSEIGAIAGGTDVWMIGSTQVQGVPWLGANTQDETLLAKTQGDTAFTLTSFSGPGQMEVYTSGNFGTVVGQPWFHGSGNSGSGSVTIPRNTHVHPNWVFTKAGTYSVGIQMTTTGKDGKEYTGSGTLTFNVGSNDGVTDGHFDFGPQIGAAGSKVVWQTKDGKPCKPNASDMKAAGLTGGLPKTGVGDLTFPLAVFAFGIGVLGVGMVRYRAKA